MAGIANSAWSVNSFPGSDVNSLGDQGAFGPFFNGSNFPGQIARVCPQWSFPISGGGSVYQFLLDTTNNKFWCTRDALFYEGANNDIVPDCPGVAAHEKGFDLVVDSPGLAGPYYVAVAANGSGNVLTVNFGATPFTLKFPDGFTSWDGSRNGGCSCTGAGCGGGGGSNFPQVWISE